MRYVGVGQNHVACLAAWSTCLGSENVSMILRTALGRSLVRNKKLGHGTARAPQNGNDAQEAQSHDRARSETTAENTSVLNRPGWFVTHEHRRTSSEQAMASSETRPHQGYLLNELLDQPPLLILLPTNITEDMHSGHKYAHRRTRRTPTFPMQQLPFA